MGLSDITAESVRNAIAECDDLGREAFRLWYGQTPPEAQATRLWLAVGWTDLYRMEDADLIEAKRSAAHRYTREALRSAPRLRSPLP